MTCAGSWPPRTPAAPTSAPSPSCGPGARPATGCGSSSRRSQGLGYSPTSRTYAITSLAEARAYLAHPVLGGRLTECAGTLAGLRGRTAEQIFGEVDALKLCSSMTLFARAAPGEPVFRQVLDQYFGGLPDSATEQRI